MNTAIEDEDLWWFRELYFVLVTLADSPESSIQRIGGGRISIPEDQANDLGHFYEAILKKYPATAEWRVMQAAAKIDAILEYHGRTGDGFDEGFWSNNGYLKHSSWEEIRDIARTFLLH